LPFYKSGTPALYSEARMVSACKLKRLDKGEGDRSADSSSLQAVDASSCLFEYKKYNILKFVTGRIISLALAR
jgi:hypothetical protein